MRLCVITGFVEIDVLFSDDVAERLRCEGLRIDTYNIIGIGRDNSHVSLATTRQIEMEPRDCGPIRLNHG